MDRHYKYGEEDGEKVKSLHVFALFKECKPGVEVTYLQFHQRAIAVGMKMKKDSRKTASLYYATPLTDLSEKHHRKVIEEIENENNCVTFNLVNIRGLITEAHNKVETLDKFANLKGGKGKILAVTETHLIKGEHLKAEVKNYIPDYSLTRTDRDTTHDQDSLSKCGGTLISASSDIVVHEVED